MNENIDLTKILKDCPKGWELYSCIHGKVLFDHLNSGGFPVSVKLSAGFCDNYSRDGKFTSFQDGECCLLPSQDQRDWSKFTAPWYKKDRFDPKTLKPFDKVLTIMANEEWSTHLFSHIKKIQSSNPYVCNGIGYKCCIPYNDDTKHLVGTTDEAPEYYKYWED